jgi:hypothetical protein
MNTLTPHIEWPILCGIIAKGGLQLTSEAR